MNQKNENIQYIEEDTIDLRELWKTLMKRKLMIIGVTGLITVFALVYALSVKPVFETKAVVEIGFVGDQLLDKPSVIKEKINVVFHVDNPLEGETSVVSSVSTVKSVDNLLVVKSQALKNEDAVAKLKEVLTYIQDEHNQTVKQYKEGNTKKIEKLKRDIVLLKTQTLPKLDESIRLLKEHDIKGIEEQILFLKNHEIKKINNKIQLIKKQDIKKLEEKILFYTKEEIPLINKKIDISKSEIIQMENDIENFKNAMQINKNDVAFTTMTMLQMVNYQNRMEGLRNKVLDLELKKKQIVQEVISGLERKKVTIQEETIPNLERSKEKILQKSIVALQREREKISIKTIPDIKRKKEEIIHNQIPEIEEVIRALTVKNSLSHVRNSRFVGEILTSDKPVKPKKKLIVVVSFITGLMFSIFLAFFSEFIKGGKREEV